MDTKSHYCNPEIWGGIECTINRVKDSYFDQLEYSGHYDSARTISELLQRWVLKPCVFRYYGNVISQRKIVTLIGHGLKNRLEAVARTSDYSDCRSDPSWKRTNVYKSDRMIISPESLQQLCLEGCNKISLD